MTTSEKKLLLFLADPALSDADFSELAQSLESHRVRLLLTKAWEIRKQIDRELEDTPMYDEDGHFKVALEEIERMLIFEAGMPKGAALRALSDRLQYKKPFPSTVSFKEAVLLLFRDVDPSKVLSAAHQIRNMHVHGMTSHSWPLDESS